MRFSLNKIKEFVKIKLSPESLAELLTLHTAETEKIIKAGDDAILDVKVLPNRGDLLLHYGMAREIAALTGKELAPHVTPLKPSKEKPVKVTIKDFDACPRYCAVLLTNVKVGKSPEWLIKHLESLGLRPINNVVDITNYVMLEMGQPIHAFDFEKISGGITIRNAKKGEKIKLLDEERQTLELDPSMLVIADDKKPLALAGIKGGVGSEITPKTDTVLLEAAIFSSPRIRKTSQSVGLKTDASVRFTFGVDPNLPLVALARAAGLIQEHCGATLAPEVADVKKSEFKSWKIKTSYDYVSSLIGMEISKKEINEILDRLEIEASFAARDFTVTVPSHRRDIVTQEDIIEEIGRMKGYDSIPPKEPLIYAYTGSISESEDVHNSTESRSARRLTRNILIGLGFSECYNYSFLGKEAHDKFKVRNAPKLLNPASAEYQYMRTSLIPNLCLAVARNLRFRDTVRLYEFGNVFLQKGDEIEEGEKMAVAMFSPRSFWELKGAVESFLAQLGIQEYMFKELRNQEPAFYANKSAAILADEEEIGIIGGLHPEIASSLKLNNKGEISICQIDFMKLLNVMEGELEYEPIPKYPSVIRDLSVVVGNDVPIAKILSVIESCNKEKLIKDVDVFDIYEKSDNQLTKSIAFHVIYRADDRTLTDKEVNEIEGRLKRALIEHLEASIR
ncbi:MAG: phenylalanyl-tRNA synthetase beta chain [Parcubacteria group bacterium Licking1014_17]|nr:MAG: phenylalanyl-tRNA synthetase beta chain [Parcubacteria group bacterium Licking1014_17]